MKATMMKTDLKSFKNCDELRTFDKGRVELVHIGDDVIGRVTLQPGWKWSTHVKPIAQTEFCEAPHYQYVISGKLHFVQSDGEEFDVSAGDCMKVTVSHDAWVVGNEPFIAVDWVGMTDYAKKV